MYFAGGNMMQINIDIDDILINRALELSGLKTKQEVVELSLNMLIKLKKQEEFRQYRRRFRSQESPL